MKEVPLEHNRLISRWQIQLNTLSKYTMVKFLQNKSGQLISIT